MNKEGKFLRKLWGCVGGSIINWIDNVNGLPLKVLKLTFPAIALRQSEWRRANTRNVSLEILYGGQFMLSTQLIVPNYLAFSKQKRWFISEINNMHCYFRKFSRVLSSNLLSMRNVRKHNPVKQGTPITLQAGCTK